MCVGIGAGGRVSVPTVDVGVDVEALFLPFEPQFEFECLIEFECETEQLLNAVGRGAVRFDVGGDHDGRNHRKSGVRRVRRCRVG